MSKTDNSSSNSHLDGKCIRRVIRLDGLSVSSVKTAIYKTGDTLICAIIINLTMFLILNAFQIEQELQINQRIAQIRQ